MTQREIEEKVRRLATDCSDCRRGFCCGQCLCCMPEEAVANIVREAQAQEESE